jgi:Cu(I)/Ag(I) efflux system membrane protein CusA/SilA
MLLYLDLAYEQAKKEGRLWNLADLRTAVLSGAVKRIRPKFMTVATPTLGRVPIMWSIGTGSGRHEGDCGAHDRWHLPHFFMLELLVYPAIFEV